MYYILMRDNVWICEVQLVAFVNKCEVVYTDEEYFLQNKNLEGRSSK
jgi:hypothetical protein